MQSSMLLQVEKNGPRIRLDNPVRLFDGSLFNNSQEPLEVSDHDTIGEGSAKDEQRGSLPCISLQIEHHDHYLLERSIINAGIGRFREYTPSEKRAKWQSVRLNVLAHLNDERLYLVHCLDHVMLSWRRVDAAVRPLSNAKAVMRDEQKMIVHSGIELSQETLRALEVYACRALYALWMDVGSVLVAISGTGTMAIREVWSIEQRHLPIDRELLGEALRGWLKSWEEDEHLEQADPLILLGADPEFILVNQEQKVVSATDYFLDTNSMYIGIDALLYKNKLIYPIVELRPAPQADPHVLFASVFRLLKEAQQIITDEQLAWLAGAMPKKGIALGGHLHISGVRLTPRLLRMLDAMLAIPFAAVADRSGEGRLRKFGGLGDYRRQFHGGFEYRTLPSWLVSPALTKAAITCCWLTLAKRKELANELQSLLWLDKVYGTFDYDLLSDEALRMLQLQVQFASSDPELVKAITPLEQAVKQRKTWNEQADLRERWSLLAIAASEKPT